MSDPGCVVYRGPSLLTGDPIVAVVTGLSYASHNPKTGAMAQVWVLRSDIGPMTAKRRNVDDAVCGTCALRGHDGVDSACYVTVWFGPNNVWKAYRKRRYRDVGWPELQARVAGQSLRLGAYGDPAAVPFEVWRALLRTAAGWVGYTHAWRTCDPRLKTVCMASVDSEDEFHLAHFAGWRTFRVRAATDPLIAIRNIANRRNAYVPLECVCPASDEAGHRTTCHRCQLCRGTGRPARSVVIVAHGKPSNLAAFYRSRSEATA